MDLKYHFLASALLAAALYPLFGINSLWAFAGGFFIDIDHYLYATVRQKQFNPIKVYRFCKGNKKDFKYMLHIFHTVEVWITLFILSLFSKVFLLISAGLIVHMSMDFIQSYYRRIGINYCRAISLIEWIIKRDHIKKVPKIYSSSKLMR